MKDNNKLRVAAYARVSTDKDDQANSLESQKSYFADYITNHEGWELYRVYYDEGISGTQTKNRDGFNQMIQDAEQGEMDLILTKEVSRFARNTVDLLSYTRRLKDAGVGVIFTLDNHNTLDADGELRLSIMASMAQEESRRTSERVKWGQRRRMEQGVVFGRDLLGYTVKNGVLSINEKEAPIVKRIFHKYTNEGKGTCVIAKELLKEGMRPKIKPEWSNTVILRVLRNEKYVGDLCQQKTRTPDYLTHAKKYNHGEEEMIYLKDHHEPIIDRDLWDRTQEELKRRSPSEEQKAKYSNRYWCSGKVRCAVCGSSYVTRIKNLKQRKYKAWRCYQAANYGTQKIDADGNSKGCNNGSVNDRTLLSCMSYCISLVQGNSNELKKEILNDISRIKKESNGKVNSAKIQSKICSLEEKKRKAVDAMLEGVISKDDLQKQTEWYNEELTKLNLQLADALDGNREISKQVNSMEQYIKAIDEILEFNEDNEIVYREVLDKIEVHQGNIVVVWLKCIPFGIQLKYKNTGKGDFFKTEIIETTFIEEQDEQ